MEKSELLQWVLEENMDVRAGMFKARQRLASAALGVAYMSRSDDEDQEPPQWPSVNYSAFGLVCRIQFLCAVQACLSDEQTHMSSKTPDTPYVHVSQDATLKGFATRCYDH